MGLLYIVHTLHNYIGMFGVGGVAASYSAKMTDNSIVNDQKFITCATDKNVGITR